MKISHGESGKLDMSVLKAYPLSPAKDSIIGTNAEAQAWKVSAAEGGQPGVSLHLLSKAHKVNAPHHLGPGTKGHQNVKRHPTPPPIPHLQGGKRRNQR